jgi:hypothetical protein
MPIEPSMLATLAALASVVLWGEEARKLLARHGALRRVL